MALAFVVDRARRGGSGALHPQSALAGLNSRPSGLVFGASTPDRGVDGRVPRGERSRTRSDPGGSSLKRIRSCVADQPGRSRRSAGTPEARFRRRVHGPPLPMSDEQRNAAVVQELMRRWNAGDYDSIFDLYRDDIVMTAGPEWPEQGPWEGKEQVAENQREWLEAWDRVELEVEEVAAHQDKVGAIGTWHSRGRARGVGG